MILVVGGGVAGLSAAWALARRGEAVRVLEAGQIGRGASWAAAGYLEPAATPAETPEAAEWEALEWRSLRAWPGWVAALEAEAGMSVDFRTEGQLRVGYAAEAPALAAEAEARRARGWRVETFDGDGCRALEPALSAEVAGGFLLPEVAWADGRRVCAALAAAIRARGGAVEEGRPVRGLRIEGGRVTGVETEAGVEAADRVVLAAGWRFGEVAGAPAALAGFGMKGVILTLGPGEAALLGRLVKGPEGILCPRGDGRLLVGVTRETAWETEGPEAGAVARLLAAAIRLAPGVAARPFLEATVGVRPFVEGMAPVTEAAEGASGLVLSLGHGADGYLRAPALSERVADLVQRRNAPGGGS